MWKGITESYEDDNKLIVWMIFQLPLSILDCFLSRGGCPIDKLRTLHSCWPLNEGKKKIGEALSGRPKSGRGRFIGVAAK